MFKRIAALFAAISVLLTSIPVFAAYDSAEYIALGDSIARGYGLSDPENDSYPAKFALQNGLEFKNYGVDGQTAKELLAAVQNDDYTLSGASVITVTVGSNELLQYIIGKVADEFDVDPASEDLNTAIAEKVHYLMETESANQMLIHISNLQAEFEDNEEIYAICDELDNKTLPALAAEIRNRNPDAQLIFTNIYNPYKNMNVIYPLTSTSYAKRELGKYFQPYIDYVNNGFVSTDTYIVADIASVFNKPGYVNASLDMRDMDNFTFDPHPTRAGHNVIKNVINAVYVPASNDKDPDIEPDPDEETRLYGDVDFDGTVTAADSAEVLQYTLNKGVDFDDEALIRADVNSDGAINSADSAEILQKALVSSYEFDAEKFER